MNILNKLDDYLLQREKRKRTSHYPSDITACLRQLFWKWTDEPVTNPIEAGALWKMEIGSAIHNSVNQFLQDAGVDVVDEVEFKHVPEGLLNPISGRVDNLFIDDDGNIAGIEVKTSFGQGIKKIQISGEPKLEHVTQIACYLFFTEIKKFYLVYMGRDNAYRTQFTVTEEKRKIFVNGKLQPIIKPTLIMRLKRLETAVKNKVLPEKDFKACIVQDRETGLQKFTNKFTADKKEYKADWPCSYCNWRNKCWEKQLQVAGKWYGGDKIV